MAFTGKATYSAGTSLPELAEDVSDLVGLISPYETPLLDALGDPMRARQHVFGPEYRHRVCRRPRRPVPGWRPDSNRGFGRADAGHGR